MAFADRLFEAVKRRGTPAMVGIDPRLELMPTGFVDRFGHGLTGAALALEAFGKEVVEIVAPLVPAVKFQAAFYELLGPEGMAALLDTAELARRRGLIVLLDGKRNDIGSTAEAYAEAYLGQTKVGAAAQACWAADALTVNPYLGTDGIAPFVQVAAREDKGLFVLVRTSNPSAREFQDLVADGRPLYRHVAERLAEWAAPHVGPSGYSLVGAVVGATYPEQLVELRAALPGIVFLVPGYGSQGGSAHDVAAAFDDQGLGAVVNNSRGVTFAYRQARYRDRFGSNWARAVEEALREMIDDLAVNTSAGRLRST